MAKWTKRKIFRVVWFSLAAVFFVWNWLTFQSWGLPNNTFDNSGKVRVSVSSEFISFQSTEANKELKVIFFQGGMTDPKAYAPLCRQLAENGYTTYLIKADWRLPRYDYQKILTLFNVHQQRFVVAGHSQGGLTAAQIVYENPGAFKGLILLGTSHPRDFDLSDHDIPVMKIYAEHDGLASVDEVMQNKPMLPVQTEWVYLKGGNHSQFGYLGNLLMDDNATISLEEQQRIALDNMVQFLDKVSNRLSPD